MTALLTEIKKIKRRYIWLLLPLILLLDYGWMGWVLSKAEEPELLQGYYNLLMNFPLVNTITLPLVLAAIACRLCDVENKGNTYKLLCTLEDKSTIYKNKLIIGGCYILSFTVMQVFLILILGWQFNITQMIPWKQMGYLAIATFSASLIIYLLQQILSLLIDNQLYPLFIGLIGTFLGLFSWFFPTLPMRNLLPWGYYCVGTTINYIWHKEERILEYFTIPFSYGWFFILFIFAIILYQYGRYLFMKKEV